MGAQYNLPIIPAVPFDIAELDYFEPEFADEWNSFLSVFFPFTGTLMEKTLGIYPARYPSGHLYHEPSVTIGMALGNHEIYLTLSRRLLFQLCGCPADPESQNPDLEYCCLASEANLESEIEQLEYFLNQPVRLFIKDDYSPAHTNAFFELQLGEERHTIVADFNVDAVRLLKRPDVRRLQNTPFPDWLRIPVSFLLGHCQIPLKAVKGLALGDVVLLHNIDPDKECEIPAELRVGREYEADISLDKEQVKVRSLLKQTKTCISEERLVEKSNGEQSAPIGTDCPSKPEPRLENLEMEVEFELGKKLMNISEIAGIKPGHVMSLDHNLEKAIAIRINGQKIGTGEMVRVGSVIGVRVLSSGFND